MKKNQDKFVVTFPNEAARNAFTGLVDRMNKTKETGVRMGGKVKNKQLRKLLPKEADEQMLSCSWIATKFDYYEWIHIANENLFLSLLPMRLAFRIINHLKKLGLKKGVPDIMIFRTLELYDSNDEVEQIYKGLVIEVKRQIPLDSPVSPEQAEWLTQMKLKNGWYSIVCYGAEQVQKAVTELYKL